MTEDLRVVRYKYLKMTVLKLILGLLLCAFLTIDGAKILGIFPMGSKSHHILGSTLLKALAKKGHQVTMISPFPFKTPPPNYEDIELTGMSHDEDNIMQEVLDLQNASLITQMISMRRMTTKINDGFLGHTVIKDLMNSNRQFDLVIQCWFGNEAALAIPHHFGAPAIAFSTIGSSFMSNSITANSAPFSYVPEMMIGLPDQMTFWQRLTNAVACIAFELNYNLISSPDQEYFRQKYFPTAPPTSELVSNIALVLLNSHVSIESPRPYVPSMVQIGGFHVQEAKELKGDLKQFMDSATDGVIFFSLGSNVKSSDLSKDKLDAIVGSFAKVAPLKVLWKFETDNVPHLSTNVKIGKWLPQGDILAHPNLKLFVTHGGLLSITEAVYHGVPMVGIPIFADQENNVEDGINKGYVVKVDFQKISEAALTKAINEVLNNPKYQENIRQRSLVLKDQPQKPMDKAVFWVEYVIRHKGAHHLKTSALKLRWYQYYLLDVLVFLAGIALAITILSCFILCKLCKVLKKVFRKKPQQADKLPKDKKKSKTA